MCIHIHTRVYIYIYIYIYRKDGLGGQPLRPPLQGLHAAKV